MDKNAKKKKIKKIPWGVLIFIVCLVIVFTVSLTFNILQLKRSKDYENVYCVMEDTAENSKLEMYFDYQDNKIYRYTLIGTKPFSEDINIERYEKGGKIAEEKSLGLIEKYWFDEEKFVTMDIYMLPLMSDEEFKQATGMTKKDFEKQTKQEVIDSIIVMGQEGTAFHCE